MACIAWSAASQQGAEPVRAIVVEDPMSLAGGALGSEAARREALQKLGLNPEFDVREVRSHAVQLDADPELEVVLALDLYLAAAVLVFDKGPAGWRETGGFHSLALPPDGRLDELFELREIVSSGTKDLLLRGYSLGAGGGYSSVEVWLYRLRDARLHEVFKAVERVDTICLQETSAITYPPPGSWQPGYIVVRATSGWPQKAPPVCGKPRPTKNACTVYRWDEGAFVFAIDRTAAGRRPCRRPR